MARKVNLCTTFMDARAYGNCDKEQAWQKAESLIRRIAAARPDIVLLPELFLVGDVYERFNDPDYIEYPNSPMLKRMGALTKEIGCYLAAPVLFKEGQLTHNSLVLFDRQGNHVFTYHKVYPTAPELTRGISPGQDQPPCFDADFGRIGVAICFDLQFKPLLEHYRKQKIDLLLFPTYLPGGCLLQDAARTGQYYVLSSHAQGEHSLILDDYGRLIAEANHYAPALCKQVNLDSIVLPIADNGEKIQAILLQYGSDVEAEFFRNEGCMHLISNHPKITVNDLVDQFELVCFEQYFAAYQTLRTKYLSATDVSN